MGCGPSRNNNKHPGLKLPKDCSGSICDLTVSDASGELLEFTERVAAQSLLMDVDTLKGFMDMQSKFTAATKYSEMYSKSIEYLNENGANISEEQVTLLNSASHLEGSQLLMNLLFVQMMIGMDRITSTTSTWYSTYVEMLYEKVTHTPRYTPVQLNTEIDTWLSANPAPNVAGFTNQNSSLQTVINNVKNNKVSGFTDFKPYDGTVVKNRFMNDYHSF